MSWLVDPPLLPVVAVTFAVVGLERLLELAINRHNSRILAARGAIWTPEDGLRMILAAQVVLFLAWPIEAIQAPWAGTGWWTWPFLALAVLAQALRYWCITTLGERWSIRVVTVPGAPRIERGPYRFFPHPNYVAVAAEALVLPLAFGAIGTALVAFPLQLAALRQRIRREERALQAASRATGVAGAAPAPPREDRAAR